MLRRLVLIGVAAGALAFVLPSAASAARLVRIADGFDDLTQVTAPRGGDKRGVLFVVEQEGEIWRRLRGKRTRFLDIRAAVLSGGERGLLSMAFAPRYGRAKTFYVAYTNNGGDIRVARYRTNRARTKARPSTRRILFRAEHSAQSNHNGGQLAFGPGGRLYFATGDGGGACDPNGNAQRLGSKLGKLWSLDPARVGAGWRLEGYGLRNPWRFSFDRARKRLYIGDVGQNAWEEIDTRRARALGGKPENYGWDVYEGRSSSTSASGCSHGPLNTKGRLVWPVSRYGHAAGRCSITGGFAYRGKTLGWLRGSYVFGDFCSGEIWRIKVSSRGKLVTGRRLLMDTSLNITSFGEGVGGRLYVAEQSGAVYKLVRS